MSSSSMSNVPQQFRAAQFTKEGGDLELRETRMKDPRPEGAHVALSKVWSGNRESGLLILPTLRRHSEMIIRVCASGLNST